MPRKVNEENERIKRQYLTYQREARGRDKKTIDMIASALFDFEKSTGFKSFKAFRIEQAIAYKQKLSQATHQRTGKPLSKATISSRLRMIKPFIVWLADKPGYKSRISYGDAEYFNLNTKDMRVAHAHRDIPYPTLDQCRHAFLSMPEKTIFDIRDKAIFAFLMITGIRDGALASLTLKRIDLVEGCVHQDARDVKTKASKTFTTWFLPVGDEYRACVEDWFRTLCEEMLFGYDDALFPKPEMIVGKNGFEITGLSKEPYASATKIREVIKEAFTRVGLHPFAPHSFRKTLSLWGDKHYQSREAFRAFSQNMGHENVATTVNSYIPVSRERQAELIRGK